jgi:hypothetical protein
LCLQGQLDYLGLIRDVWCGTHEAAESN